MKVEAEETLRSLREVNSSLQLKQLRQQASWKQSRAIKTCLYYITFTCYATRVQKAKQRGFANSFLLFYYISEEICFLSFLFVLKHKRVEDVGREEVGNVIKTFSKCSFSEAFI